MIIQGQVGTGGFANNRFAELSAGKYCMTSALIIKIVIAAIFKIVIAAIFIIVIRVATDQPAPARLAPVATSLALTLIHLISIPITLLDKIGT